MELRFYMNVYSGNIIQTLSKIQDEEWQEIRKEQYQALVYYYLTHDGNQMEIIH